MRVPPLSDDADLPALIRHVNQVHVCMDMTQDMVAKLDKKVNSLTRSIRTVSKRLGVDQTRPEQTRPMKEPLSWRSRFVADAGVIVAAVGIWKIIDHLLPLLGPIGTALAK